MSPRSPRSPSNLLVRANLVIAANGATTLAGRSHGLSSGADRERFHEIREWADCILIGGESYRSEPYQKTPVPLFVASHTLAGISPATVLNLAPVECISEIASRGFSRILIEGGAHLLQDLLGADLIDSLYITRAAVDGDGGFVELDSLTQSLTLESSHIVGAETFLHFIKR